MKLEARNIMKQFDECILKDISLNINEKDILAVTGPSGCGKSTLLSILGLLIRPTEGEILYNGEDVSQMSDKKVSALRNREFGFIFQNTQLLNSLTVLENILLPANIAHESGRMKRAKELIMEFGLGDRMAYYPYQLSIGQRRRASIARALLLEPRIIFADEPTNDLDGERAGWVEDFLLSLPRQGYSVVVVSHDQKFVNRITKQYEIKEKQLFKRETYSFNL